MSINICRLATHPYSSIHTPPDGFNHQPLYAWGCQRLQPTLRLKAVVVLPLRLCLSLCPSHGSRMYKAFVNARRRSVVLASLNRTQPNFDELHFRYADDLMSELLDKRICDYLSIAPCAISQATVRCDRQMRQSDVTVRSV